MGKGERRRRRSRSSKEPRGRMETANEGFASQKTGQTAAQDPVPGWSVVDTSKLKLHSPESLNGQAVRGGKNRKSFKIGKIEAHLLQVS